MSGGSDHQESPHDKQCPHCNKWYRDQGVSFAMHKTSCDANGDGTEDTTTSDGGTSDTSASEGQETGTQQPEANNNTNPLKESPTPSQGGNDTSGDTGGEDTDDTDMVCLDCGSELIDYRNHSTDPDRGFLTPDDYYCSECGQGFNER